jgi:methylated-DNA-protein-cysteine methyltransferase-like protein
VAKSAAFVRIKGEVLGVVRDVPYGRVTSYAAVGRHLGVMARHVAYVLAMLGSDERTDLPWHRVVAEGGAINRTKRGRGAEQDARLVSEGVAVANGRVTEFDRLFWTP